MKVRKLPKILDAKEAARLLDVDGFHAAEEYLSERNPSEQEMYLLMERSAREVGRDVGGRTRPRPSTVRNGWRSSRRCVKPLPTSSTTSSVSRAADAAQGRCRAQEAVMAGTLPQTLLLWAARRMTADGFLVAGFDGTAEHGGRFNALPAPFVLRGRRPDAWGADEGASLIAFAEAKSAGDILAGRTVDQFRTFGSVRTRSGLTCPLYVAIRARRAPKLDTALRAAGLTSAATWSGSLFRKYC